MIVDHADRAKKNPKCRRHLTRSPNLMFPILMTKLRKW